jgi:hypothetical protein
MSSFSTSFKFLIATGSSNFVNTALKSVSIVQLVLDLSRIISQSDWVRPSRTYSGRERERDGYRRRKGASQERQAQVKTRSQVRSVPRPNSCGKNVAALLVCLFDRHEIRLEAVRIVLILDLLAPPRRHGWFRRKRGLPEGSEHPSLIKHRFP